MWQYNSEPGDEIAVNYAKPVSTESATDKRALPRAGECIVSQAFPLRPLDGQGMPGTNAKNLVFHALDSGGGADNAPAGDW